MRMPPLSAVFSPSVRLPFSVLRRAPTSKLSYSLASQSVRSLNLLAVVRGLPARARCPCASYLRALVVEAVRHLVADDHADAAEVHRRVRC